MSGKDVVLVLGYEIPDRVALPRKVDVGISVASGVDQLLFVLYSSYCGRYLDPPGRTGFFRCCLSKLPLTQGRYFVGARVVADHDEADWPKEPVGCLDVERGDFYGTGSAGFAGPTPFLVNGEWEVVATKEPVCPSK
jgi:hypothetical protein